MAASERRLAQGDSAGTPHLDHASWTDTDEQSALRSGIGIRHAPLGRRRLTKHRWLGRPPRNCANNATGSGRGVPDRNIKYPPDCNHLIGVSRLGSDDSFNSKWPWIAGLGLNHILGRRTKIPKKGELYRFCGRGSDATRDARGIRFGG